ncbi:MAG: class I SAM-dependent methyltransferase [Candidatus Heimdallarchaeota archaeon]
MSRVIKGKDYKKFEFLTFEDFRRLAKDEKLSRYEKIGFPEHYRKGYEKMMFEDVKSKLRNLREKNKIILDIGCGCSGLAFMIIEHCKRNNSKLLLVDSHEMLSLLPNEPFIEKFPCRFPDCPNLLEKYKGKVDGIIIYSVLHHVFLEANIFDFIDKACELLKDGGEMLIGDIPNVSKRKRFFSSKAGIKYHQEFTGKRELPKVDFMMIEDKKIDDGAVFGILQRYRNFGFDTYLLPQDERLPMANRREDILIKKP